MRITKLSIMNIKVRRFSVNKSRTQSFLGWSLLVLIGIARASELEPWKVETSDFLDPVIELGFKERTNASQLTNSINSIELADWEILTKRSLQDGLDIIPGVYSISTAGQRGQTGSLFIRGFGTNKNLIVIDGISISNHSLSLGSFLGSTNLLGIERIEVLKGSQSTLHAGNAVAGVVGLYTQGYKQDEPEVAFSALKGDYQTFDRDIAWQKKVGNHAWRVQLGQEETQNEPETEEIEIFENQSFISRYDYTRGKGVSSTASLRGNHSELIDKNEKLIETDILFGSWSTQLNTEKSSTSLNLGVYREDYAYSNSFGTLVEKKSLEFRKSYDHNDAIRTQFGVLSELNGYERFSRYVPTHFSEEVRDNSTYVNQIVRFNDQKFQLEWGFRHQTYEIFENANSYRVGGLFKLTEGRVLRVNYATAYRPPTHLNRFQNHTSFGRSYIPNPSLKPETANNLELGLEIPIHKVAKAELTYFKSEVDNSVQSIFVEQNVIQSQNVEGASTSEGLEVALRGETKQWKWLGGATLLNRVVKKGLPELRAKAAFKYLWNDKETLGLKVAYTSEQNLPFIGKIDPYTLVDLSYQIELKGGVELIARINNLLDKEYFLTNNRFSKIEARGRGGYLGLKLAF